MSLGSEGRDIQGVSLSKDWKGRGDYRVSYELVLNCKFSGFFKNFVKFIRFIICLKHFFWQTTLLKFEKNTKYYFKNNFYENINMALLNMK